MQFDHEGESRVNDNTPSRAEDDSLFDLAHEVLCTVIEMADDTDEAIRVLLLAAHELMREESLFGSSFAVSDALVKAMTDGAEAYHNQD
ncbi:hypothetical protein ASE77_11835 [Sphingomonas sp. Leaf226]|nr:hypothetical protein ASE77_11835 [Sphingomonas sp. Leaf226]